MVKCAQVRCGNVVDDILLERRFLGIVIEAGWAEIEMIRKEVMVERLNNC